MKKLLILLFASAGLAAFMNDGTFKVSSPAFDHNGKIPSRFGCTGINTNPELELSRIPENTKSIAIVMTDPENVDPSHVNWLIWNLPPSASIPENVSNGIVGRNSDGTLGYEGPCRGSFEHRFFFRVYALDDQLNLPQGSTIKQLEMLMKDHLIGSAEIIGLGR